MFTTPIEQKLLDELKRRKIACEPQKPVGFCLGVCRSKFPCRCGQDWSDPDTDVFCEGNDLEEPEECEWWADGYYKYYIDIYIPVGPGLAIEVDDWSSHSQPWQIVKDVAREREIKHDIGCEFMRFRADTVYNRTKKCAADVQVWVNQNKLKVIQASFL